MTGRKDNLRDVRSLENAVVVKFGNNHKCQVKGYGKVTNGQFTMNCVAYVEGLKHNFDKCFTTCCGHWQSSYV